MSGLGRYIVDAVVLEHRSPTQLAATAIQAIQAASCLDASRTTPGSTIAPT